MLRRLEVVAKGLSSRRADRVPGAVLALVLLVGGPCSGFGVRAQEAGTEAGTEAVSETPVVAVLGASVSAGFADPRPRADGERNEAVRIRQLLPALWPELPIRIVDQSEAMTFSNPGKIQGVRVARVQKAEPDLVLAVDFPFWFGYGPYGPTEARLRQQRKAFEFLESFDVPCLAGDYPDMSSADPGMLPRYMIPSAEGITALNQGFADWVGGVDHVHPFPLATFVDESRERGIDVSYGSRSLHLTTEDLMQADRLHPSPLGAAVLVYKLGQQLREILPEDHPLRPAEPEFARLVRAADVEWMVEEILEREPEGEGGEAEAGTPAGGDGSGRRKRAG